MLVSLIVAAAENGVIGKDNQLLWRLPDDLKRFKKLTMGCPIIMGRKTYESIGKPLPGRTTIIITRSAGFQVEGACTAHSVQEALELARAARAEEAFIIGGGEIYRDALAKHLVEKIYLTEVRVDLAGDTYFVLPDPSLWQTFAEVEHAADERHAYSFRFVDLVLKNAI